MRLRPALLVLLAAGCGGPSDAPLPPGPEALEKLDKSRQKLERMAQFGDPVSLYELCMRYMLGQGLQPREGTAVELCARAARQGHPWARWEAQRRDGRYDQMADTIRKAAQQGDVYAEYLLGLLQVRGQGVPKDEVTGARGIRKGAEAGHAAARLEFARLLSAGRGIEADPAAARKLRFELGREGYATASSEAALDLFLGRGGPADARAAIAWLDWACELGEPPGFCSTHRRFFVLGRFGAPLFRFSRALSELAGPSVLSAGPVLPLLAIFALIGTPLGALGWWRRQSARAGLGKELAGALAGLRDAASRKGSGSDELDRLAEASAGLYHAYLQSGGGADSLDPEGLAVLVARMQDPDVAQATASRLQPPAAVRLARRLRELRRTELALACLDDRALAAASVEPEDRSLVLEVFIDRGRLDELARGKTRSLPSALRSPWAAELARLGLWEEARGLVASKPASEWDGSDRALLFESQVRLGRFEEARGLLDRAADGRPAKEHPSWYYDLAGLAEKEHPRLAAELLRRLVEADPNYRDALVRFKKLGGR